VQLIRYQVLKKRAITLSKPNCQQLMQTCFFDKYFKKNKNLIFKKMLETANTIRNNLKKNKNIEKKNGNLHTIDDDWNIESEKKR